MQAQAQALRKAMEGWGTDEDALIKVVANVTNNQRQQITTRKYTKVRMIHRKVLKRLNKNQKH